MNGQISTLVLHAGTPTSAVTASAANYAPEEHHSRYQGIKHLQSLCRVCHSESDNEHLKHAFENVDEEDVRGTPASRKDEQDGIQGG